jgi:hypothetical protein
VHPGGRYFWHVDEVQADGTTIHKGVVWTQWKIPLSSFPGVDLHQVRKMSIGVGGREFSIPPGTGRIYFDDIRVLKP